MEFSEHGTTVAPYVIRMLRLYLLGPDTVATVKVRLIDEGTPLDTAPRPVEPIPTRRRRGAGGLDPASRAHPDAGDSLPAPRSGREVDRRRQLLLVSAGLILFGLLTLYSARRTPTCPPRAGVWIRQFVWVGIGMVAALVVFHVSPRLLEWLAPVLYGFEPAPAGAGAAGRHRGGHRPEQQSWLTIGGRQIGQPSELAKVATVLMLARYLSSRKEPPARCGTCSGPASSSACRSSW